MTQEEARASRDGPGPQVGLPLLGIDRSLEASMAGAERWAKDTDFTAT